LQDYHIRITLRCKSEMTQKHEAFVSMPLTTVSIMYIYTVPWLRTEKLYSQPWHSIYVHYGNCSKRHAYTLPVSRTLPPPTDLDPIPKSWSFLGFQMEGHTQDPKSMTSCSHRPVNLSTQASIQYSESFCHEPGLNL